MIKVVIADFLNPTHQAAIISLMQAYASDPMGGGEPLPESTLNNLCGELAKRPYAFSLLAYVDGEAAGLINCFEQFSTFACQPLINIHDVMALEQFRGLGLSQQMLDQVELIAQHRGCCKLTLEVLSGNGTAQAAYEKFGFSGYQLSPETGHALFWQKLLTMPADKARPEVT